MASQTDLDQGGTQRAWVPAWLGPSIGWVWRPATNVLAVTAAGTYALDRSTSLVTVNTTGSVTITMPSSAIPTLSTGGQMAQPGLCTNNPITIVDIGGNAQAHPITIQRNNSSESIMGLTSIQITVNYGGYVLQPEPAALTWNSISP